MSATAAATATPPARQLPWIFHEGEFIPAGNLQLSASTQALNYGTATFEGIRAYYEAERRNLHIFRPREHYERLIASARILRVDLRWTAAELCDITTELMRRNSYLGNAYIRPLAYKVSLLPGASFGVRLRGVSSMLTISALPMGSYVSGNGIRCALSSFRRIPAVCLPPRAKIAGGYVSNALARDSAEELGFDDAILLDTRGLVAEATTANVFMVESGKLITPPATADILLGVTRASVLEFAPALLSLQVLERPISADELCRAAEVFLTGTGTEITPVIQIDNHRIGDGQVGPITRSVKLIYNCIVGGTTGEYPSWRTSLRLG